MAKQKVVLKLSMENAKKRAKAMKCAVGLPCVVSASHEGDTMTVVGEGIDSVMLTTLLRKKMGIVQLVTVMPVNEKKEEKKEVKVETVQQLIWPYNVYGQHFSVGVAQPIYYEDIREPLYNENSCSIM